VSLDAFFEAVRPFLEGRSTVDELVAALGPTPSPAPDLAFYPWLVAFDQRRILAELCPAVKALVDQTDGLAWDALVAEYVADCPPTGHSVPAVGERLSDWLTARRERHPEQPVALECLADLAWTRFLCRSAPDDLGLGMDRRVHVRHYPVDVIALDRALKAGEALPEPRPTTLVVYRDERSLKVRHTVPSLHTLAVLALEQGQALAGPFAAIPTDALAAERARLVELGVLPA
jgi:hypothetical protein